MKKGNNCCQTDCIKNCLWGMHSDVLMDLIPTWSDDRYCCTPHFDTGVIDLDLDSGSQDCEKAETTAPIISQSFQLISVEFGLLWRLPGVTCSTPGEVCDVHPWGGVMCTPGQVCDVHPWGGV